MVNVACYNVNCFCVGILFKANDVQMRWNIDGTKITGDMGLHLAVMDSMSGDQWLSMAAAVLHHLSFTSIHDLGSY